MVTKKALLDELDNKYTKNQLNKACKDLVKSAGQLSKKELLKELGKLNVDELCKLLKPPAKEGRQIKISLRPNKWTISAVSLAVFSFIVMSGALNYTMPVQGTSMIYIVDSQCADCFDVTGYYDVITGNFGLDVNTVTYDINSTEGMELVNRYQITKIPTFILIGSDATSNSDLVAAWSSAGTIESDGAMVFRSPDYVTDYYEVLTNGSFVMYEPPVQTIGSFIVTGDDLCTNADGKPIIYFFGSSSCPHCHWVQPVIGRSS